MGSGKVVKTAVMLAFLLVGLLVYQLDRQKEKMMVAKLAEL